LQRGQTKASSAPQIGHAEAPRGMIAWQSGQRAPVSAPHRGQMSSSGQSRARHRGQSHWPQDGHGPSDGRKSVRQLGQTVRAAVSEGRREAGRSSTGGGAGIGVSARWTALRRAEEGLLAGRATPGENPPAVRAFRRRAQQNGPATRAGEGQLEAAPSASRLRREGLFGSGLPAHRAPDRAARGAQTRLRRHGLAAARAGGLPGRRAAGRAAGRALRQRSPALRAHLPQGQPARRARGGVRRHPRAAIGAGLGAAARARLVGRHHRPAAAARPGPQGRAARRTGLRFRRDGRVTVAAEPGPDRSTSGAAIRILRHGGSARRAESGPTVGANALLREDLPAASRAGDELDHAVGAPSSGFALPPGRPVQPSARWARASARFRQ